MIQKLETLDPNKCFGAIKEIKSLSPQVLFDKTQKVRSSFIGHKITSGLDGYPYSLFPLADGPIEAELVEDMADLIVYYGDFKGVDLLVSEADRGGGPLTQAVAAKTKIPFTLANWHAVSPNVPGVVTVQADIGFSGKGNILVYGIQPNQRVVLIDDLISSGGTSIALFKAIQEAGATIDRAFFVGEKVNKRGRELLKQQFPDVKVTSLVRFISEIENGVTIEC